MSEERNDIITENQKETKYLLDKSHALDEKSRLLNIALQKTKKEYNEHLLVLDKLKNKSPNKK